MKQTIKTTFIIVTALFLFTGCYLNSVHPLVTEEQSELLEGLEGRWESEDQRWTFVNDGSKFDNLDHLFETDIDQSNVQGSVSISGENKVSETSYILILENLQDPEADSIYFFASVGQINEDYFLDLYPIWSQEESTFLDFHLFPVHTFSKLQIVDDELQIRFFKDSWIKGLIENNQVRIKHEKVDEDILITASNAELRKFVEKYGKDEKAFEDPLELTNVYKAL